MVAMFKYSKVATYSVALPPPKLEFGNSMKGDLLKKEFENVGIYVTIIAIVDATNFLFLS